MQFEEIKQQFLTAIQPLLEAYAPIHQQLSKPLLGPFSGYFTILLLLQFVINFWPSKSNKVSASHILVNEENLAKKLKKEIQEGKLTFQDAALKHSICPSKNNAGELGSFSQGQMVQEFENVCFDPDTEVGVVYGPVNTKFGYHLIKVTKKPDDKKVKKE